MSDAIEVLPPEQEIEPITEVDGHRITPKQFLYFQTYYLPDVDGNGEEARRRCVAQGYVMSPATAYKWRNSGWWKKLAIELFGQSQNDYRVKIAAMSGKLTSAMEAVLDGDPTYHKTANAVVQANRVFGEIGDDPLIKKRPNFQSTTNITNNTLNLTQDQLADRLRGLSQEQLIDYNRSGKLPELEKV